MEALLIYIHEWNWKYLKFLILQIRNSDEKSPENLNDKPQITQPVGVDLNWKPQVLNALI